MFTGIVEDLGTVERLKPTDQGAVITIHTTGNSAIIRNGASPA